MERSRNDALTAVHHADLVELVQGEGPFLTVWAATPTPQQPDVSTAVNAALRGVRGDDAVPAGVVEELESALTRALPGGPGVVAVADPTGVRLVEQLPQAPRAALTRVAPLPSLAPVIEHRQGTIPFLLVIADRTGADLYWSTPDDVGIATVDGDVDHPITKVRAGGWSHRRMQQRVENFWEQNADDVVDALRDLVAEVRPRVITVSGDVRMLQLLREKAPAEIAAMFREVPGSRSEDGSDEARDDAVRRWVRTAVAEDTVAVLQSFEAERGRQDRAADGAHDTLQALREARVDILIVHDDHEDDRTAWYVADDPTLVSEDPAFFTSLGRDDAREGRLVDVAVRAALCTGAGVRVVPAAGPVSDRLGAILRW